jgi:Domain of Unknown Function (DUF1259)
MSVREDSARAEASDQKREQVLHHSDGIDVVAIHHHMTEEKPMVIFLHYWGRGSTEKLANAFKAALDDLGKGAPSHG